MVAEAPIALEPTEGAAATQERLLVEFELDGECYGVDIGSIREIIRYQPVTVIPGAPDIVEGIINLRGRVTPIVDLRKRLGLNAAEVNDTTRIIVIDVEDAMVGVHVDAVTGVISLTGDQLQQLSTEVTTDRSNYLEGVADVEGRLIVLINLQAALEGGVGQASPSRELEGAAADVASVDDAAGAAQSEPVAEVAAPAAETPAPVEDPTEEVVPPADESPAELATDDAAALGLRVELLEQSFEAVKPHAEDLVVRFYENLFQQHPGVQPLFAEVDMGEQRGKLLAALATVVASLRQPDVLVPHLEELGRRHVAYGAEPAHYEAVGTVLVETLGEIAGDVWTNELRDAWSDAVSLVATVMIDAASQVEVGAPTPDVTSDEVAPEPVAAESRPRSSAAKKPVAKRGASKKTPAKKKPAARKSTAKKPAAKASNAKKPATRKASTASKAPAATKQTTKKTAAKKPAAKKPRSRKAATTS